MSKNVLFKDAYAGCSKRNFLPVWSSVQRNPHGHFEQLQGIILCSRLCLTILHRFTEPRVRKRGARRAKGRHPWSLSFQDVSRPVIVVASQSSVKSSWSKLPDLSEG